MPMDAFKKLGALILPILIAFSTYGGDSHEALPSNILPTLDQVLASKQDLWGNTAISQTNGPSYEFFERLLPPIRYVNTAFHHYPLVLSAPNQASKARLVSNGSAVNPVAITKTWNDVGTPVSFFVGNNRQSFGGNLKRLTGPNYEKGYLPIVQMNYTENDSIIFQENFVAMEMPFGKHGVLFIQFKVKQGKPTTVFAKIDSKSPLTIRGGAVRDTNDCAIVWFDEQWNWEAATKTLSRKISSRHNATLAIATKPMEASIKLPVALPKLFTQQRQKCATYWQSFLDRGMQVEAPESVVNNAWRSLLIANYMLTVDNRPNYSAHNAYARLYEAECGDTARAFLLWGYPHETAQMIPSLLDYLRKELQYHNAGFKLQLLAHYFWMTRDTNFLNSTRTMWMNEINRIVDGREKESGLLPRENYCGDIFTQVYSLHSNAASWRGLKDFAAVLDEIGEHEEAARINKIASEFRAKIIAAVEKSERRDVTPTFIPIALFGEEKPYETLTSSMMGSYWNLIAPYVLGSEIFVNTDRETAIIDYLQQRGGIALGMIRFDQHSGLFANMDSVDDLYGLRYVTTLLRRDAADHALVSFYGKLAQGLTRDTFIGAEGTSLRPLDEFGRAMYLPPNSSAQALFLWNLRYLLVQDWDLNQDGKPETLRLCFATPRAWLQDGKTIKIKNAPSEFGELSVSIQSRLRKGEVIATLDLPNRNLPEKTLLRIRLPDGWEITSAAFGKQSFQVDEHGTIDISALRGHSVVKFKVKNQNKRGK